MTRLGFNWGHVHARTLGTLENPANITALTQQLLTFLAEQPEKNIHFHYTPIHFGPRGEIKHRAIDDTYDTPPETTLFGQTAGSGSADGFYHPRVHNIALELAQFNQQRCDIITISETHNSQEVGAMALRDALPKL